MRHIIALLLTLFVALPAPAEASDGAPVTLIITYQAAPAARTEFRRQMAETGLARLQGWKKSGLLKDFRVLESRYADSGNWDFMVLLGFAGTAEVARWKAVEQETPAGLPPAMLGLATTISSVPAELIREDGAPSAMGRDKAVFLAIPYRYLVPRAEYETYLDGYTLPQLKGWIGEKALARYGVYLSQFPADRPWNAMLLLEYRDEEGLAARDRVVARVRARLAEDPEWKAWAEAKKNIRDERQAVVADELLPQGGR